VLPGQSVISGGVDDRVAADRKGEIGEAACQLLTNSQFRRNPVATQINTCP
jgi:hypothetical protein